MTKQLFNTVKVVALALVLSFGLSYALAWTAPGSNPPAGNVAAPLNVSATAQTKAGGLTAGSLTTSGALTAGSLTATGLTTTGTLKVTTGAGVSKVLTSDAAGNATWQTPAAGTGDNLGNHTATQNLNLAGFGIAGVSTIGVVGNGTATFGPNSTWGANLVVGGNGRTTTNATMATTNGNLHLDAQNGGFGTYLNWYASGTTGVHVGNGAAGYGPLYASDVYINSKARWASSLVGTTVVYGCPFVDTSIYSNSGYNICGNTCVGSLSQNASCNVNMLDPWGSCVAFTSYPCSALGKLQP